MSFEVKTLINPSEMFPRPHRFLSSSSSPIVFATVLAVFCFFVAANADSTDLSKEQGLRGSFGHMAFLIISACKNNEDRFREMLSDPPNLSPLVLKYSTRAWSLARSVSGFATGFPTGNGEKLSNSSHAEPGQAVISAAA